MSNPKLILLHGALGSKEQLLPLADSLSNEFEVHLLNFLGHGDSATEKEFSIEVFAEQLEEFIPSISEKPVSIFGYSMGGYVALYLAKHKPHLIDNIITLGTKMFWNEEIAAREQQMLDLNMLQTKAPAFIESVKKLHAATDYRSMLSKTQGMMKKLGNSNLLAAADVRAIRNSVLLMLGDKDKMVSLQETVDVFRQLPNAKLAVLPGTPHIIEKVDTALLSFHISHHLNQR